MTHKPQDHAPVHHVHPLYARHEKLPEGFTRRRAGKKCPLPDDVRVELMIHTSEGLGSSGPTRPTLHDWSIPADKLGGIVGFRLLGAIR